MSKTKKAVISLSALCLALILTLILVLYFENKKPYSTASVVFKYSAAVENTTLSSEYMFEGDGEATKASDDTTFSGEAKEAQSNFDKLKFSKQKHSLVFKYTVKNNSESEAIALSSDFGAADANTGYKTTMAFTTKELSTDDFYTIIGGSIKDAVVDASSTAFFYVKIEVVDPAYSYDGSIAITLQKSTAAKTDSQGILRKGEVVERGRYPQTFVGTALNKTLISAKEHGTLSETGNIFHTEINKVETICKEYEYEGENYVCVESASFYGDDGKFSTGETFYTFQTRGPKENLKVFEYYDGKMLFFKVEPIKFMVMEYTRTTMTLDCMSALGSMVYGNKTYWKGSNMEKFLSTTFMYESGLSAYTTRSTVKNSLPCKFLDGSAEDSFDYIWIASVNDLQRWYPNQKIEVDLRDPPLTRPDSYEGAFKRGSDFAYATNTPIGRDFVPNRSNKQVQALCSYHLRTPGNYENYFFNCAVSEIGSLGTWGEGWYSEGLGYCPVFIQTL